MLVPGSMGTSSYVLVGSDPGGAFSSACHGAGRTMSRHAATRQVKGAVLRRELERQGICVRAASARGLAEEAPFAYKDVDEVVATCERAPGSLDESRGSCLWASSRGNASSRCQSDC